MNYLLELIRDVCVKIIDSKLKSQPKFWSAKVVASSGSVAQNSNASVYLNGDSASTPVTLKNKSNETLVANSECFVFSPTGSLNDAVILIKK